MKACKWGPGASYDRGWQYAPPQPTIGSEFTVLYTIRTIWFTAQSNVFCHYSREQEKINGCKVFEGLFIFLFFILMLVCSV